MASESSRLVYTQIINLALGAKLDHPNMQTATGGFVREAHLAPPRPSTPLNDDSVAALAAAPEKWTVEVLCQRMLGAAPPNGYMK